jgi:hypothetical protein
MPHPAHRGAPSRGDPEGGADRGFGIGDAVPQELPVVGGGEIPMPAGAAPADEPRKLVLGRRRGLRPAGHYEPPARSWLTTGENPGESAARRRRRTPQWSAERRAPFAKGAPPQGGVWCASRRSAPLTARGTIRQGAARPPVLPGRWRVPATSGNASDLFAPFICA